MKLLCTVLLIWKFLHLGNTAKILGLFVTPSISHQQTFQFVCKELALRGHDVTFVSPNILNDKSVKNLREIDVHHVYDVLKTLDVSGILSKDTSTLMRLLGYWQLISVPTEHVYKDEKFQRILRSNETFDILIIQAFHPLVFAVAAQYKVPTIGLQQMECQILFGLLLTFFHSGSSAKILGYFTSPSYSHHVTFQPIYQELALRGHDVTVVTPHVMNDKTVKNLKEIDVKEVYDVVKRMDVAKTLSKNRSAFCKILTYNEITTNSYKIVLKNREVEALLRSDESFDILIVQAIDSLTFSLSARYRVPVIGISSYGVLLNMHDAIGNPTHPIITPDLIFTYDGDMTFWVKVNSFLYNIWYRALFYWYELPKSDKIARKYFGNDMPYLGDLVNNVSLMMVNVNPILNPVRANVPNVIEINQIHIKKSKPLPKDLQELLDSSTRGVVYFSLGSNVKSANLSNETREEIIAALAELPYNILWKWEADHLPNQPKNVHVRKWLPQQDILGHPNVKVFVTQGGLQSSEEAIAKGIPVVGIPFIADQPRNVQTMVEKGLGVKVEAATLTKDALKDAIMEVAQNEKYKKAVLRAKSILEDQPLKGVDKAVWWIEYVIRNKDVSHLRSPAANMSFFEYFMIDVILFLLLVVIVIMYMSIKTVSLIYKYFKHKPSKLKSS